MTLDAIDSLFALVSLAFDSRMQRPIGIAENEFGHRRCESVLFVDLRHHFINRARYRHGGVQLHRLVVDRKILTVKNELANIVLTVRLRQKLAGSRDRDFYLRVLGNVSSLNQSRVQLAVDFEAELFCLSKLLGHLPEQLIGIIGGGWLSCTAATG